LGASHTQLIWNLSDGPAR